MGSLDPDERFRQAATLYQNRRYREARVILDELGRQLPLRNDITYARALCLAALGRPQEARALCEKLAMLRGGEQAAHLKKWLDERYPLHQTAVETPVHVAESTPEEAVEASDTEPAPVEAAISEDVEGEEAAVSSQPAPEFTRQETWRPSAPLSFQEMIAAEVAQESERRSTVLGRSLPGIMAIAALLVLGTAALVGLVLVGRGERGFKSTPDEATRGRAGLVPIPSKGYLYAVSLVSKRAELPPDTPVLLEKTPDGEYKLAQLVRCNQALYDFTRAYRVPLISGKDSMKNDYKIGDTKISIPPTVLFTAAALLPDVSRVVSMDAKRAGDVVYLVGDTRDEMGGSEYLALRGELGSRPPQVDAPRFLERYRRLADAIAQGLVASCHDCSDGGLGAALAETAFAGELGMDIDLRPMGLGNDAVALFSESAGRFVATVPAAQADAFERTMAGCDLARLGVVIAEPELRLHGRRGPIGAAPLRKLKEAWQRTLRW